MRILLRSKRTAQFYAGTGQWTKDPSAAQEFKGGDFAVKEALKHSMREMEIVYSFDNPDHDITTPIHIF